MSTAKFSQSMEWSSFAESTRFTRHSRMQGAVVGGATTEPQQVY